MKKIILLPLFFLCFSNLLKAQFKDDFERYNYTQRISPQSLNWITWSENPSLGNGYVEDEDGIVANIDYPNYNQPSHFAYSGKQALFIGKKNLGSQAQDVILDLHNKSKGLWNLSWQMYIPKRNNKAYYSFQENTPTAGSGNWAVQVYFNGRGRGQITDDNGAVIGSFTYPWSEWFEISHTIDLDNDTIKIVLITKSSSTVIYNTNFLSTSHYLGGVNFYAIDNNNSFYIDDVSFDKDVTSNDVFIWNNNRWENVQGSALLGEPDSSFDVILKEPFIVGTSTPSNNLNCLNLVLENGGSLTIPQQTNTVISGNLTVPISNKITVEDGGSFVMLNNSATIDILNTGSFEYIRKSAFNANAYDFTYWSTPVENINVSNFSSPAVYTYQTANYIDLFSGSAYPQTTGLPDSHDDNGDDWLKANNSDNVVSGVGYAVVNSGVNSVQTISFNGVPNNGFIATPVALSGDNSNEDDDWNLIGNPYPSAIDASILINSNINISGTLYFWTHNTELGGGVNDGPSKYNYNTNDYATFNLSGGVAATTGGQIPNGYIAAGQGFFMEVNNNGVVTFNNDMRIINTFDENTQFYKESNDKKEANENVSNENKIWLNFKNDKGVFSQALIAFLSSATDAYEGNYDGIRAGAGLNSTFYSILGDKELAIQGRALWTEDVQIPLGFYITSPDDFTISIAQLKGLITDENKKIYLVDHELNVMHDLKIANYHFDVFNTGTNNTRFTLQFAKSNLGIDEVINSENFIIKNMENGFEIQTNQIVKKIEVYDMLGRLLFKTNPNKHHFNLPINNIRKGTVLVINATLENNSVLRKKTIQY